MVEPEKFRSRIEMEELEKVFVTQKEQGEFAVKTENRFGTIETAVATIASGQKWNRNLLILIASSVIVDIFLTVGRYVLGK